MSTLNTLEIIFFLIFVFSFVIQMTYYLVFFSKLAFYSPELKNTNQLPSISVVIAARNEYQQLKNNLPQILNQNYPDFEVIVVNHASIDDTTSLLKELNIKYKNLKVIHIEKDLNFFHGKKFPLSIGIKSAQYDTLLLTDADCQPASQQWITNMASSFTGNTEVVLGYGPYISQKGLLNKIIRYDTFLVAMQYLSYALAGKPYMGVGRNLSYKKNLFYKNKGFTSHYNISSGDDDLFISSVANKKNTHIELSSESFMYSKPKQTFKEWVTQKKRHLSTGGSYPKKFKLLLGTYGASIILFYIFLVGISIITKGILLWIVLGLWFLKWLIQFIIHKKILTILKEKQLLLFSLIWEPVHALVLPFLIFGKKKKNKWK